MAERLHLLENSPKLREVLYEQVQNLDHIHIPLLSFKSERETKQESLVATLPYESPLYIEIVELFSKNQHFCIASHKPVIRPLSLKLSCDPATRSSLSDTPHKYSFI